MSFDPEAVRRFEQAGWQQAAPAYAATFAGATSRFADVLLDAAGVAPGMRVLDIACGPGVVAAAARARGAIPIGLDFSAAMIALARAAHSEISFEEGDAEALPYCDASFDAAVSNFGIHHIPDPVRALSEARRVLRPGGRIAFTSWAAPCQNIAWNILFDAISRHGDLGAAKAPASGGGLRAPEDLLRVLKAAGSPTQKPIVWPANGALPRLESFSAAFAAGRCGPQRLSVHSPLRPCLPSKRRSRRLSPATVALTALRFRSSRSSARAH